MMSYITSKSVACIDGYYFLQCCYNIHQGFVQVPENDCPCTANDTSECYKLPECSYDMNVNELCEADQILPDGQNYEVDNCPDNLDVFRRCVRCSTDGKSNYSNKNVYSSRLQRKNQRYP